MTVDDRAAKRAVAKANREALLEAAKIDRGIAECLATREGRALLWWLLSETQFGHNPHTANALNTAFNCGRAEVGLRLIARIEQVDAAGFVRMQLEKIENVNRTEPDASAGTIARDDDSDRADELGEWGRTD